ncbi:hypothetical protein [Alkalimonas amylolytica]|uniref:hypothetical protein n=1 Tax=Alkalimonas amylolytica TaxID=152573 RepID=UPI001495831D|nr:hypothetical protein [Alkalimonas amylolytica]
MAAMTVVEKTLDNQYLKYLTLFSPGKFILSITIDFAGDYLPAIFIWHALLYWVD